MTPPEWEMPRPERLFASAEERESVIPEGMISVAASDLVPDEIYEYLLRAMDSYVLTAMLPTMRQSGIAVVLVPENMDAVDTKSCIELGAMLYLGKPIMAVVRPGCQMPPKIAQLAFSVVHADLSTEEGRTVFQSAVAHMVAALQNNEIEEEAAWI